MEKEIAAKIQKGIDEPCVLCYNNQRWFKHGEMAERLMALVLKTSDTERYRGFESLSLRQLLSEARAYRPSTWRSTQVAEGAPLLRE